MFHRTHIGRLEEPQISHESVCFSRIGKIVRMSDCEELVGAITGDGSSFLYHSMLGSHRYRL